MALGDIGPAAKEGLPALVLALQDASEVVRLSAARSLGDIGIRSDDAVKALKKARSDKDGSLRVWTAYSLCKLTSEPAAAMALINSMSSEDVITRRAAACALGHLGPEPSEVVPALINALRDQDLYIRVTAVHALGTIGPRAQAAVPALSDLLRKANDTLRRL
jgi:HEAT repeat protein